MNRARRPRSFIGVVRISTVLIGTKRMLPWRAAVAIASASLRSFLDVRRQQNGRTKCAAIRRGCRPWCRHRRAR